MDHRLPDRSLAAQRRLPWSSESRQTFPPPSLDCTKQLGRSAGFPDAAAVGQRLQKNPQSWDKGYITGYMMLYYSDLEALANHPFAKSLPSCRYQLAKNKLLENPSALVG